MGVTPKPSGLRVILAPNAERHWAVASISRLGSGGLAIISRAAVKKGMLGEADCASILRALTLYDLPTSTDISPDRIAQTALSDKKRAGSSVSLIVPRAIGKCEIVPVPVEEVPGWVQAGM